MVVVYYFLFYYSYHYFKGALRKIFEMKINKIPLLSKYIKKQKLCSCLTQIHYVKLAKMIYILSSWDGFGKKTSE